MNAESNGVTRPTRKEIAARAYKIWEKEGRPPGQELEYWLRAERELTAANSGSQEQVAPSRQAQTSRRRKPVTVDERAFRIFH
jgi:hypothetical protein